MRPSWLTVCLVALTVSCAGNVGVAGSPGTDPPSGLEGATVTRVVDGDTIHVLFDGRDTTIRIIGIDTPEKDGPYTEEECFGREASDYTNHALGGARVGLEFDVDHTDRYDRTLAHVWVGDELFGERILRDGFAVLLTIAPNVRYVDRLTAAQAGARDDGAGLWGSCPTGG